MVELAPENLQLVAIYGLVLSVSVIIFGAFIGDWIDKSKRLTAAKFFLAVQNLSTTLSCVLLGLYFGEVILNRQYRLSSFRERDTRVNAVAYLARVLRVL
jgi:hypothetical protein